MVSQYVKLKKTKIKRGRPRLSAVDGEKSRRVTKMRQEARRRSHAVLQHNHGDEYAHIYKQEYAALITGNNISSDV